MKNPVLDGGSHRGPKNFLNLFMHYNDGLELVYVWKGHSVWKVEDRAFAVSPGDLFFTLPWEMHGGLDKNQPGLEIDWLVLDVGDLLGTMRLPQGVPLPEDMWQDFSHFLLEIPTRCLPAPASVGDFIHRIVGTHNQEDRKHRIEICSLLSVLFLDIWKLVQDPVGCRPRVHDVSWLRVMGWVDQIRADPESARSLNEMAKACELGRSRFSDLFKKMTGDSPIQYVNRVKIQKACTLLATTEQSITDIAFASGFESSQYFARLFRTFLGCNPTQYRRHTIQEEIIAPDRTSVV